MASIHSSFTLNPDGKPSTDPRRNPFKDEETSSAFTARLEDAMEYWHVPGFTIGIIDEHFVTCRGYGVSKAQGGDPVTPKTLWNCASMSKSFTAAGLALLVEEEALKDVNWETPVQKLCEEFVVPGEGGGGVSIEDVLCHRSGLPG
jgi:CubicO group peptidase (beta-lactamase class C family)